MRREPSQIERLLAIMRTLRDPNSGCPWDIAQSFQSIAKYTLEEAYEVTDAIARNDVADIKDELGDLLLQVVFHAQIASDQGLFNFSDVVASISDKMIRRHPHVFGTLQHANDDDRETNWEADKKSERTGKALQSALDGIPPALPALVRAVKLAKRAALNGFDWEQTEQVWAKIAEEISEFKEAVASGDPDKIEDEMGDVLFVLANLARHHDVDPETALRRTNDKFTRRFQGIEQRLAAEGKHMTDVSLEEMEAHWVAIKRTEKETPAT